MIDDLYVANSEKTQFPRDWEVSLVKYLARYINGYAFKPSDWGDEGKPILRIQNLSNPETAFNRYAGELSEDYLIRKGDILISWSASLNVFIWEGEDAWLNQHIFKVDVNENIVSRDYFLWLATWFISELAQRAHGSTMQHLTRDAFGSFPVLIPPFLKQRTIADYLARSTVKIDALIVAKQRLLDLLAEKRRAVISQAVIHGLTSAGQLVDTSIPWIKAIPSHWKVKLGRYLFTQSSLEVQSDDEIVTCFRDGEVTLRSNRRTEGFTNAVLELGYQGIKSGQLVLHSMDAFAGAIGVSDSDGKCTPEYIICDPATDEVFNPYYALLLREMALRGFIQASCPAVRERAPRVRFSDLKDMLLPLPPVTEQKEIVSFVKEKLQAVDQLISLATATIELLHERRGVLISEAVTGRLQIPTSSCN